MFLKDLDGRYNAMLQMYGEKVEEVDELRLDLQDVKDMYKGQVKYFSCILVYFCRCSWLYVNESEVLRNILFARFTFRLTIC